jgi:hypothetical protein
LGKDTSIDWEDIYTDWDSLGFSELGSGFHTEMEKRMRM